MAASGSREEDFAVTEEQEKLEERELTNWLLGRLAKISEPDREAGLKAQKRFDSVAKPLRSLGVLEDDIVRIAEITGTPQVDFGKRALIIMCADNGIVEEGISQTGKEVTAVVTANFTRGESCACLMAQQAGADVFPVDIGVEMDLGKPFARITMVDAVKKYAGVDFDQIHTLEEARAVAKEKGVEFEGRHKKGDILNLFFEEFAEEHLVQPTFVLDHPVEISPLTKKKPGNPDYVERFEFFMNGWEMANAYSEINDPIDQRERFRAQEELLAQGDEEANHTDEDFLNALEVGMPPTGGIGFGIDRMVMLLTDSPAIRDVLLFPTMKPLD